MRANPFSNVGLTLSVLLSTSALIQLIEGSEMAKLSKRSKIGLTAVAMDSLADSESALVDPLHTFGSNLFKTIKEPKKNILLSPLSVHSALSMLLLGASPSSDTEKELRNILGIGDTSDIKVHESYSKLLAILKAVTEGAVKARQSKHNDRSPTVMDAWNMAISKGEGLINQTYLDQLHEYYKSSARKVSDAKPEEKTHLIKEINEWAKTSGFGDSFLSESELDEQFSILLLSAIRVESSWFEEFSEIRTKDLFHNFGVKSNSLKNSTGLAVSDVVGKFVEFSLNDTAEHKVLTDGLKSKHPDLFKGLIDLNFQAAEIGLYGNLSYAIFKPINSVTGDELQHLEEHLLSIDPDSKQTKLSRAFQVLDSPGARANIDFMRMPAFKFENEIGLKQPLMSIGLARIFDKEKAEFSKISTVKQFVSEAKHRAVIEVNKSGLKAAAITTIKIVPLSLHISSHPIRVIIDNPFLFVIRYDKIPLFIGHVVHL